MALTPVYTPRQRGGESGGALSKIGSIVSLFGPQGAAIGGAMQMAGGAVSQANTNAPTPQAPTVKETPSDRAMQRRMEMQYMQNPDEQIDDAIVTINQMDLEPEVKDRMLRPLIMATTQRGRV